MCLDGNYYHYLMLNGSGVHFKGEKVRLFVKEIKMLGF